VLNGVALFVFLMCCGPRKNLLVGTRAAINLLIEDQGPASGPWFEKTAAVFLDELKAVRRQLRLRHP
jgi:hypothetical protein